MKTRSILSLFALLVLLSSPFTGCTGMSTKDQLKYFENETGLRELPSSKDGELYLGKQHNGYEILFTSKAGNVWGRFAARIALSELLDWASNGNYTPHPAGSQLDRLLARVIGQPVTIVIMAKHKKPEASRLDIITPFSTVQPNESLPKVKFVGLNTGSIYSRDPAFANRILSDEVLMNQISDLWHPYIHVDSDIVLYTFSGQETDLSAMIREHGSYTNMINSAMDTITAVADKI